MLPDRLGAKMTISFQIPPGLEDDLRFDAESLNAEAKEALLVALYRRGRLTHLALSQALDLDRFETDELLRKHAVTEDLGTLSEYLQDGRLRQELRLTGR